MSELLRAPEHRVSPRAVGYWTVSAAIGWLIPLIGELIWLCFGPYDRLALIAMSVTAVVGLTHVLVMPRWRYRVHRWECTSEVVYTQSGWLNQERRIVPVSRIQTVDTERGPLQRLFGLATVTVTTASARGPVRVYGLDLRIAQQVADELATRTQTAAGDAT